MNGMCPLGFILAEFPWFFNLPRRQILRRIGKNFRFFTGNFCKSPNLRQILHTVSIRGGAGARLKKYRA